MRNLKILALRYVLKYQEGKEVQQLNMVIKCIMESVKEDSYCYLSQATAEAAALLSQALLKHKRVVYNKFNSNLCLNLSTNYTPS